MSMMNIKGKPGEPWYRAVLGDYHRKQNIKIPYTFNNYMQELSKMTNEERFKLEYMNELPKEK